MGFILGLVQDHIGILARLGLRTSSQIDSLIPLFWKVRKGL